MAQAILNQPYFQEADKAREYLEALRWPHGPVCPHCGSIREEHLKLEGSKNYRPGLYKCADCYQQFTVTVGTVFERSKIALNVWLQAVHLMCASKKGISAKQLERMLGVTYKTAWFMAHRIREAMTPEYFDGQMGGGGGAVEVDETYYGNKTDDSGKALPKKKGGSHKMAVVSLVDRQSGEKRSFHMPTVNKDTVGAVLKTQVAQRTQLMTDESRLYTVTGRRFFKHETVNHSRDEYVRGEVTTNTVESSFALLKRGLHGTFHAVSEKHLQRYLNEFDFRWTNRQSQGVNDVARQQEALKGIAGKRLTYRRIGGQQEAHA